MDDTFPPYGFKVAKHSKLKRSSFVLNLWALDNFIGQFGHLRIYVIADRERGMGQVASN
jgi:hypothetical protein